MSRHQRDSCPRGPTVTQPFFSSHRTLRRTVSRGMPVAALTERALQARTRDTWAPSSTSRSRPARANGGRTRRRTAGCSAGRSVPSTRAAVRSPSNAGMHTDEVLGQEATGEVGQLAAMRPNELWIEHGDQVFRRRGIERATARCRGPAPPGVPEMGSPPASCRRRSHPSSYAAARVTGRQATATAVSGDCLRIPLALDSCAESVRCIGPTEHRR